MAMQDRAKANHDLHKDAKINHVFNKGSMVANPFFGNSQCSKPRYPCQDPYSRSLATLDVFPVLHLDVIP